jgi:hypothetical protein
MFVNLFSLSQKYCLVGWGEMALPILNIFSIRLNCRSNVLEIMRLKKQKKKITILAGFLFF